MLRQPWLQWIWSTFSSLTTAVCVLTGKEGLRLFGYPDDYSFDIPKKDRCDLLGNTVAVPVIKAVSERLLHTL